MFWRICSVSSFLSFYLGKLLKFIYLIVWYNDSNASIDFLYIELSSYLVVSVCGIFKLPTSEILVSISFTSEKLLLKDLVIFWTSGLRPESLVNSPLYVRLLRDFFSELAHYFFLIF